MEALLIHLAHRGRHPQPLEAVLRWPQFQSLQDIAHAAPQSSHSALSSHHRSSLDPSPSLDLEYPACLRLMTAFFAHVHPKNPILNEHDVLASLKQACFEGFRRDANASLLLLLLANGALATPFGDGHHETLGHDSGYAQALFLAAQERFALQTNPPYFVQAKFLFYSGIYLMCLLQPFDAWRRFLEALAVCQALPSLSTGRLDSPSERDGHEESLYWSCWKSEREVRSELGLLDFANTGLDHPQL